MKQYRAVLVIGIIEILIGATTLLGVLTSLLIRANPKPLNVLLFVIVAASISTSIGFGVLKFNKTAYRLLYYFSTVVILSKILIFLGVIHLSGALEHFFPAMLKNILSVFYHGYVILFLNRKDIRKIFNI